MKGFLNLFVSDKRRFNDEELKEQLTRIRGIFKRFNSEKSFYYLFAIIAILIGITIIVKNNFPILIIPISIIIVIGIKFYLELCIKSIEDELEKREKIYKCEKIIEALQGNQIKANKKFIVKDKILNAIFEQNSIRTYVQACYEKAWLIEITINSNSRVIFAVEKEEVLKLFDYELN